MVVPYDIAYEVDVGLLVALAFTEFLLLWCIARDIERRRERVRVQEAVIDRRLRVLADRNQTASDMIEDGLPSFAFEGT